MRRRRSTSSERRVEIGNDIRRRDTDVRKVAEQRGIVRAPVAVLAPFPTEERSNSCGRPETSPPRRRRSMTCPIRWSHPRTCQPPPSCSLASVAMSAERATYLDSSALVKLAVRESESATLRRYLHRKRPLVTSALSRTEVARALLPFGEEAVARGEEVLQRLEVIRINDRVLRAAGALLPFELRSLDAIHLATAIEIGTDLSRVCTYDEWMAAAAVDLGLTVVTPS